MDKSTVIRDKILQAIQKEFCGAVAAEIDGTYFKAADVALPDSGGCEVYRIDVIRHGKKSEHKEMSL